MEPFVQTDKSVKQEIELGIELLQVALGVRPMLSRAPSDKEWDEIFHFAEEQAIMGVLFGGVERLPAEQRPYMDLLMERPASSGPPSRPIGTASSSTVSCMK